MGPHQHHPWLLLEPALLRKMVWVTDIKKSVKKIFDQIFYWKKWTIDFTLILLAKPLMEGGGGTGTGPDDDGAGTGPTLL